MWGNTLVEQLNQSNASLGTQVYSAAQFVEFLAQAQTNINAAWTGDPSTTVTQGSNSNLINWGTNNVPLPQSNVYFTSYFILAVLTFISKIEGGETGDSLQQTESAQQVWNSQDNVVSNQKNLQVSPLTSMLQQGTSDINNTQSQMQSYLNFITVVGSLSSLVSQLTVKI